MVVIKNKQPIIINVAIYKYGLKKWIPPIVICYVWFALNNCSLFFSEMLICCVNCS